MRGYDFHQRRIALRNWVVLEQAVDVLRSDAQHAAILLDIDGTFTHVGMPGEDLKIPETTRNLLRRLQARYRVVGFVTGRTALNARQVVGLEDALYFGNHGSQRLEPGQSEPTTIPGLEKWEQKMRQFINTIDRAQLEKCGVYLEDKGTIIVLHYRGAADAKKAKKCVEAISRQAHKAGFSLYQARAAVEIRPRAEFHKGTAIASVLEEFPEVNRLLFAGDDTTDTYGFQKIQELVQMHRLQTGVAVAVRSAEQPPHLLRHASATVDGPPGVAKLLAELVA